MSDTGPNGILNVPGYFKSDAKGKRHFAVASALDLISKKITASSSTVLEFELDRLSSYADKIQAAIEKT
ncbi:hypothetical protein C9382_27580 [Pseudomonas aylmerensis]|jgi:hypothetical protein|uniref:Uncharacterized protein n=1 Tax=Pseudomonas aylmerensis TaxID=1869229 RepID=A0A2T4FN03_9PSED|nr:hypothetical protein [Pseudomonas aylmerensis]OCW24874.1 hypothetical protein BBG20_17520 [Pseudomonas aylmerensis]PTC24793.1 hypothetical protein C9382_27580 [Pseudomonas aylmerensis]